MKNSQYIKVEDLYKINYLFLDTAPIIYYVENNQPYSNIMESVFRLVRDNSLKIVTSSVTLAECLIIPYKLGLTNLQKDFIELIVYGKNTIFISIDSNIAVLASKLRANYNLSLTDAFQVSTALIIGCEAFITNDLSLKRVKDLKIIILDELLDSQIIQEE